MNQKAFIWPRQLRPLFPLLSPNQSIGDAQEELEAKAWDRGGACPCCGQNVKVYRRRLNANMAQFLCSLVVASDVDDNDGWVHYSRCRFTGRDYSYLEDFDLAMTYRADEDEGNPKKRMSGFWKPTKLGALFARDRTDCSSHVLLYDNQIVSVSKRRVRIRDALGTRFDYQELMRPAR